jgi:hypothetical protein
VPGFKAFIPPPPFDLPAPAKAAIARYWEDPLAGGHLVPSPADEPVPCHRFFLGADVEIRGLDRDGAAELARVLQDGPVRYGEFATTATFPQLQLLKRLIRAGVITVEHVAGRAA